MEREYIIFVGRLIRPFVNPLSSINCPAGLVGLLVALAFSYQRAKCTSEVEENDWNALLAFISTIERMQEHPDVVKYLKALHESDELTHSRLLSFFDSSPLERESFIANLFSGN